MSIYINSNFEKWLDLHQKKTLLKFLTCGSVDDGKSTLIGRLLHDTQQIYDDQLSSLRSDSKRHGTQGNKIDLALIVDGLQSEREQGITIDVAYRYFSTDKRKFIIADTPGHKQYTRNMVTGASTCDLSILLVDARKGLSEQTYRHSFISTLLGIKYLIVAINKMDLVNYKKEVFINIKKKFLLFSKKLKKDLNIFFVPISALVGENIVFKNNFMPWYEGLTLLNILETIKIKYEKNSEEIRFPVQYINRPNSEFRGYSGTLLSGSISVGQSIKILPVNINSSVSRIVTFDKNLEKAEVGEAITIVLKDQIDINRGDFFVNTNSILKPSQEAIIDIVWMTDDLLLSGESYNAKLSGKKTRVYIKEILFEIDINTLIKRRNDSLSLNSIGRVKVMFSELVIFDNYNDNRMTGNIIFIDCLTNITVGAGMIRNSSETKKRISDNKNNFESDFHKFILKHFPHWNVPKLVTKKVFKKMQNKLGNNIFWQESFITRIKREKQYGYKSIVVWFTGLSGSGKSSIANHLEKILFNKNIHTYLLDGDNVRSGLCSDLNFSIIDRQENIRRIGEVSKLMLDAGILTLVSVISPYRNQRKIICDMLGRKNFLEIFVDTPIHICEDRDPKKLYKKARIGKISDFTGIHTAYEIPERPDLHLDGTDSLDNSVKKIINVLYNRNIISFIKID